MNIIITQLKHSQYKLQLYSGGRWNPITMHLFFPFHLISLFDINHKYPFILSYFQNFNLLTSQYFLCM